MNVMAMQRICIAAPERPKTWIRYGTDACSHHGTLRWIEWSSCDPNVHPQTYWYSCIECRAYNYVREVFVGDTPPQA